MTIAMPADWVTYEALAAGIDENRLPQSTGLLGTELEVVSEDRTVRSFVFQAEGEVMWHEDGPEGSSGGTDRLDAVELSDGTYLIDVWLRARSDKEALTIFANTRNGRTLSVLTVVRDGFPEGEPRVAQTFSPGVISGVDVSGDAPAPTRDLLGKRLFNDYSPNHYYEHVYLNSGRYVWQCLSGVQKGHGDCDLATYYKFGPDQYVFCFREFRIQVASVLFLDFTTMRNTGKFLGVEGDGEINNAGCGAVISWLSTSTDYPDGVEPA